MQTDTPPPPRRRPWRLILCIFLALFALLLLAAGGGAWWLWGWRAGELSFHESWTPEQRADLQALSGQMLHFSREMNESKLIEKYVQMEQMFDEATRKGLQEFADRHPDVKISLPEKRSPRNPSKWMQRISEDIVTRLVMAEPYCALRKIAATGRGDAAPGASVAQVACRMGYMALAEELIRRGEDPNTPLHIIGVPVETPFQSAMVCLSYFSGEAAPVEQRFKLLDTMLEHGADINARTGCVEDANERNAHLLLALVSAITPPYDHGAILEWLLEHGLSIRNDRDEKEAACLLNQGDGTLPTYRRLVQKGLLPDSPRMKAHLLRCAVSATQDAEAKTLWCLDELHADPNFVLMEAHDSEDQDGNTIIEMRPTDHIIHTILRRINSYADPKDAEDMAEFDTALRLLDILMEHGATPGDRKSYIPIPEDETLRARLLDALHKHTIPQE